MKAFIFAGGLGTRLRPYTNEIPKPLLPIFGKPLITYILDFLGARGFDDVTVNTYYLRDQFESLLLTYAKQGMKLNLSRQPQLYGHSGDLAFASEFRQSVARSERVLTLNGDTLIYTSPKMLEAMMSLASFQAPIVTVGYDSGINPLSISGDHIVGYRGQLYRNTGGTESIYRGDDAGLHIIHGSALEYLPEPGDSESFYGNNEIVARLINAGKKVLYHIPSNLDRVEIGTTEEYEAHAENLALQSIVVKILAG